MPSLFSFETLPTCRAGFAVPASDANVAHCTARDQITDANRLMTLVNDASCFLCFTPVPSHCSYSSLAKAPQLHWSCRGPPLGPAPPPAPHPCCGVYIVLLRPHCSTTFAADCLLQASVCVAGARSRAGAGSTHKPPCVIAANQQSINAGAQRITELTRMSGQRIGKFWGAPTPAPASWALLVTPTSEPRWCGASQRELGPMRSTRRGRRPPLVSCRALGSPCCAR